MTTLDVKAPEGLASHDGGATSPAMHALVYHGPGERAWEEKPRPTIGHASDATVRITTSTICGTDLHILKGDLPTVADGRILGHEGIGVIAEAGSAVSKFRPNDRVLISCVTACGICDFCWKGMFSHCRHGGGSSATPSMAPTRNTYASRTPTRVSTTFLKTPTKRLS